MDWLRERGVLPLMVPIDADLFKAALPEWAGYVSRDPLTAGFHTRRESGYLVELAQEASLRARQHVWVDGSLRDGEWYQQVLARIRARHPAYRIAILYVAADRDTVYGGGSPRAPRRRAATCRAPRSTTRSRACPSRSSGCTAQVEFLAGIDNVDDAPQAARQSCARPAERPRDVDLRAAADARRAAPLRWRRRRRAAAGGADAAPGPRREGSLASCSGRCAF